MPGHQVAASAEPVGKKVARSVSQPNGVQEWSSNSSRMPKGPSAYFMSAMPSLSIPAEENMVLPCSIFTFSSSVIVLMISVISASCCRSGFFCCAEATPKTMDAASKMNDFFICNNINGCFLFILFHSFTALGVQLLKNRSTFSLL